MLVSTINADRIMPNCDKLFILTSFRTRKCAVFIVCIIFVVSSFRDYISVCCISSLAYCPQIREPKQVRDNVLHNFSVRSICTIVVVIILRIQSALDKFFLSPMEHLTIDFRLIPEIVSIVGRIYSIEYHRRLIEHIAYSTRGIHSLIAVRHTSLILFVDGMATCPRISE